MVLDKKELSLVVFDWRGNEIKVGTRVVWANGGRGVGTVAAVSSGKDSSVLLGVRWEERDGWNKDRVGKISFNIRPYNCTVWPDQDED